jgi:vacuolar-type H+-ATPase subunit E/Vma4
MRDSDAEALLDGIKGEADARILALGEEAEGYRQRVLGKARAKADSLLAEARRASSARAAALRAAAESALSSNLASRQRSAEETISSHFFELLKKRLAPNPDSPALALNLQPHLYAWLLEAAIGLGEPEAVLSVSDGEREFFTPAILRAAENEAFKLGGSPIHIELSCAPLERGRGLVLASPDGRVRFDNRLEARLARAEASIRNMIADEFFRENAAEDRP